MSIYHKDVAFDSLRLQDNKVVCYIFRKLLYCKNQMDISFELHTNADSRYNDVLYPSLKPHFFQSRHSKTVFITSIVIPD